MKKIKKILTEFVEVTIGIAVLWTTVVICLSFGLLMGLILSVGVEYFVDLFF